MKEKLKNKRISGIFFTALAVGAVAFLFMNTAWLSSSSAGTAKVTICHYTGGGTGKGITLNVADDGAYNGHIPNHPNDTVGACAPDAADSNINTNSSAFTFDDPGSQMKHFREN
ncbi:hypothetical protein UR09_02950 [Candidatus Nitromaritima sp. SCGC AAA799-A02]|nr:hypothetical protein UR09_02950 [Candidatus Nitromaritima sp. SCGC AAA799-A02]